MRISQATIHGSLIDSELGDPVETEPIETSFDVKQREIRRSKMYLLSAWLVTNIVTFMLGFYVKGHWFTSGVPVDGSM